MKDIWLEIDWLHKMTEIILFKRIYVAMNLFISKKYSKIHIV